MTMFKTANLLGPQLYGESMAAGQHRALSEAARMIIETAAISCDDPESPSAAGFIASLECILSPEERPAGELIAEAIRERRRDEEDHGPGCDGPLNCTCNPYPDVDAALTGRDNG